MSASRSSASAPCWAFRWPILPLALFAALIPLEEVVVIEGLGTISRFAGILFAVTYALPRLGHLKLGAMPPAAWAYLAWAVVSVGWALDPGTAGGQIVTCLQLFVVAVFVADFVVHRPAIVRPVLWVYSLSATATCPDRDPDVRDRGAWLGRPHSRARTRSISRRS